MPQGLARKTKRRITAAFKFIQTRKCVTIAALAKELGINWDSAKRVANMLQKAGKVVVVVYGGKMLWCIDKEAAEEILNNLRMETWRLICSSKLTHVYPSRLARLISEDAQAWKVFMKYVSMDDLTKAGGLKFFDAALRDLLGEAFDRRTNHKVYAVPPDFCSQPPRRIKPQIYKPPHRNMVTFLVTEAVARDIEKAAAMLGVDKPQLVRMAIERLLEQYRHLL
jgi:Mn-dependent DtxR family transcriptional regulator